MEATSRKKQRRLLLQWQYESVAIVTRCRGDRIRGDVQVQCGVVLWEKKREWPPRTYHWNLLHADVLL